MERRKISREIGKTLSIVARLIEGKDSFQTILGTNQNFSIWEYQIHTPTGSISKYFYIVPKSENIDLNIMLHKINEKARTVELDNIQSESSNCDGIFFIDIFEQFTDSDVATKNIIIITSTEFFNYLFNAEFYKRHLEENNEFRNVDKYYIDRKINLLVDEEKFHPKERTSPCLVLLDEWVKKKSNKSLLLLGDRGIGKTWTAKAFCLSQYGKHKDNPWLEPLPIYIELANLAEPKAQLAGMYRAILFHLRELYNIEIFGGNFMWEALIRAGKIIFVLDGFDDMAREVNLESVNRQLWEIFSIINISSKVVLTSRINHFNSILKIFEHFAYKRYIKEKRKLEIYKKKEIYISEDKKIRKDFNIWQLDIMSYKQVAKMSKSYGSQESKAQSGSGIVRFREITENAKKGTMNYELRELSRIPAFYNSITKQLDDDNKELIDAFEKSLILTVIGYNIATDKALEEFVLRYGDNFETIPFTQEKKILVLQELAWYMFERDHEYFDISKLPSIVIETMGGDYEILINDIKTQTVIKLYDRKSTVKDESKFEFLTEGVYAFFVANHLYKLISKSNTLNNGVWAFGKYNLSESFLTKNILSFLSAKLMTDHNKDIRIRFQKCLKKNMVTARLYSPWLKYLVKNVSSMNLDIDIKKLEQIDSWSKYPVDFENDMVLIRREKGNSIDHYMIGTTEITNQKFSDFLKDDLNKLWRRELKDNESNPYKRIINDYHLYLWVDGKMPEGLNEHPIVYISWFVAAFYCNWLSSSRGFDKYYNFELVNEEIAKVKINPGSSGYRLPTEVEWDYAAKEGDKVRKYPWDKFVKDGKLSKIGNEYKKNLLNDQESTFPVKSEAPNDFDIYGLIGNVREWVDIIREDTTLEQKKLIKGATWLSGEKGFNFGNMTKMPALNTNLDVGFRIARDLTPEEMMVVKNAFREFKKKK